MKLGGRKSTLWQERLQLLRRRSSTTKRSEVLVGLEGGESARECADLLLWAEAGEGRLQACEVGVVGCARQGAGREALGERAAGERAAANVGREGLQGSLLSGRETRLTVCASCERRRRSELGLAKAEFSKRLTN